MEKKENAVVISFEEKVEKFNNVSDKENIGFFAKKMRSKWQNDINALQRKMEKEEIDYKVKVDDFEQKVAEYTSDLENSFISIPANGIKSVDARNNFVASYENKIMASQAILDSFQEDFDDFKDGYESRIKAYNKQLDFLKSCLAKIS